MEPTRPAAEVLLAGCAVDGAGLHCAPAAVLLRQGVVQAVGAPEHIGSVAGAAVRHLPGTVLMPPFANAHAHLDLSRITGLQQVMREQGFWAWLDRVRTGRPNDEAGLRDAVARGIELSRVGGVAWVGDIAGRQSMASFESLASSQASFDALAQALAAPRNLMDQLLHELTLKAMREHQPNLVLLSVPFPGAVYAALRIGQSIKQHDPNVTVCLGGGYVNTELRALREPRLFEFVDVVTLDAGERPVLALIEHLQGKRSPQRLVRSYVRSDDAVRYVNWAEPDIPFDEVGT
ncbi:MAG: hypothetical protein EBR71_08225, partial [Planctomycetes bacterium]|nr:hypothetical protein [Planctomycetota bacterium]